MSETDAPLRIVFVTLEFVNVFSGNGTASQMFVQALLRLGNPVFVICGEPVEAVATSCARRLLATDLTCGEQEWTSQLSGVCIRVEAEKWNTRGRNSPYATFGEGASCDLVKQTIDEFAAAGKVDVLIGVDWEARRAVESLQVEPSPLASVPYVYYNFRVFFSNTSNSDDDTAFYLAEESEAVRSSSCFICLSKDDRKRLSDAFKQTPHLILPGLREKIRVRGADAVDTRGATTGKRRRYLLCCVRVVKEKNVQAFVDAMKILGTEFLEQCQLVPYMVGRGADGSDGGFCEGVRSELRSTSSKAVIQDFVDSQVLADVMSESVLNIHPALNEAYGMTIVEAAAMGCPSLVHHCDIGALDLLAVGIEVLACDMSDPSAIAARIAELSSEDGGGEQLRRVAEAGQRKALSYDELANARELCKILRDPQPPRG